MTDASVFELYALRYATRQGERRDMFMLRDQSNAAMRMDYFIWMARNDKHLFVIDSGMTETSAASRNIEFIANPVDLLMRLGVNAKTAEDVIVTHLHYDHTGNFDRFTNARFHIQAAEMQFVVSSHIARPFFNHGYGLDDIQHLVAANFKGRMRQYDGVAEIVPGIVVRPVPGHSAGMQLVQVKTARGWVTIASDSAHYYENIASDRPFVFTVDVVAQLDAYEILRQVGGSMDSIIPGHDPAVLSYYPALSDECPDIVRLDSRPKIEVRQE